MHQPDTTTAVTANAAAEIFRRAWQAYRDREWQTLLSIYADTAELHLPGIPPITGGVEIVDTWRRFSEAFPDDGGTYFCVIAEGNIAGGEKVYHGTNTGPLPLPGTDKTLPPTGNRISIHEADFMTINNGKVITHSCYYDRLHYASQLGMTGAS